MKLSVQIYTIIYKYLLGVKLPIARLWRPVCYTLLNAPRIPPGFLGWLLSPMGPILPQKGSPQGPFCPKKAPFSQKRAPPGPPRPPLGPLGPPRAPP